MSGAGEIVQPFKAPPALAEDPGSITSPGTIANNSLYSSSRGSWCPLLVSMGTHRPHKCMYRQNIPSYKKIHRNVSHLCYYERSYYCAKLQSV